MTNGDDLSQLIRERYPFPISHAYTYLESRIDPNDRYLALLTCFEVTLKSITSIALANFMRDIQEDAKMGNIHLFQHLVETLNRPLSLGHWQDLLHLTLRPYAHRREDLVVPELFDFYYRKTEYGNIRTQSQNVGDIQRLIQERNEEAHHRNRSQTGAVQRQSRLTDLLGTLRALLGQLDFLADYPWLYVEHAEYREGFWHYRANFAQGASYPFPQRTWKTRLSVNSHRCLILNEAASRVLELDPFVIVTSEGRLRQPDIFFFDGIFSSGQAKFMSYHVNDYIESTGEGSPASVANDAISSLLKLLRNRIPPTAEKTEEIDEEPLSAIEIYRSAVSWAAENDERQNVSLDALRRILNLSREEALQVEREIDEKKGIEVESEEIDIPFEGEPTWANLAYYVLNHSGQEAMFYKDIAAEAEVLKDQEDPDWQLGDSAHVDGTVSRIMSQDPRFYKLRRGYYRLTKNSELLSNPSWANLAYFVLKHKDPKGRGMHLSEITEQAIELKEKYSDWRRENAQTPSNTVSAIMSTDRRFESLPRRGYWRVATQAVSEDSTATKPPSPPSDRQEAYEEVLNRLRDLGEMRALSFGRTYYALNDEVHLMLRYSRTHQRNGETWYFLGVTPQYFERIHRLGKGFVIFVLGSADNVLLIPTKDFAQWVEGLEPSGSGTWPMTFLQSPDGEKIERRIPGGGREDVTAYHNAYARVRRVLSEIPGTRKRRARTRLRVADLLEAGLLKPGDTVYVKTEPEQRATVIDDKYVEFGGKRWTYNTWGIHVTGWKAINIYQWVVLDRTGQTLDELRDQLRQESS